MAYDYTTERRVVFTEAGVNSVLMARDFVTRALALSGAVMAGKVVEHANDVGIADSWGRMACVDYLVERGEIRCVNDSEHVAWQNRVFVSNRS